jgi:hypothetical protein
MAEYKTQLQIVTKILKEKGEISRNFCLQNYITRLGAIICDINKKPNWKVEGKFVKTTSGKDYVYKVINKPYEPIYTYDKTRNVMVETSRPPTNQKLL